MQELEKILEEIDEMIDGYRKNPDLITENITDFCYGLIRAKDIIRRHMNAGWIPVEKFGLPHSNEHDFRFWVTIQYANGFRHTIKAKWDCFDKCFMHPNGKKISEDVVAYKYYSSPEPYRTENCCREHKQDWKVGFMQRFERRT